jgi:hypothetical protein
VRDALEEDSCTDFVVSVEAEESEIDIPIEQIHSIKGKLTSRLFLSVLHRWPSKLI